MNENWTVTGYFEFFINVSINCFTIYIKIIDDAGNCNACGDTGKISGWASSIA